MTDFVTDPVTLIGSKAKGLAKPANMAADYFTNIGSPVGVVTPDFIGQRCYDTIYKIMYVSVGLTTADWVQVGVEASGYRVVLFGDSMTDFNQTVYNVTSSSYNPTTNQLTLVFSGAHTFPVGTPVKFWNRSYTSVNKQLYLTVTSITNTTTLVVNMPSPASAFSDLPTSGNLTGTNYVVGATIGCAKSWLQWMNCLGNQRFNIVANCAQSGDTTTQNLARITDVLSYSPQVVVMQAPGINDLTYDAITGSNNISAITSNLKTIFDTFRLAGIQMIVGTITPVATGESRAQKSIMVAVQRLNEFIWNYARLYGGMTVVDAYPYIVNPADTSGFSTSGYLAAADNIHYTNVGAYKVAKNNLSAVLAAFPSYKTTLPASTLDSQTNSALASPSATAASNIVTVSSAGSYIQKNQEVFIRGATGSYIGINGRQVALASDGSGSFRFLSATTIPDGSVTGSLAVSPSRQLFADPLIQTTSGGTTSNGITGTAAGQLMCSNGAGNTGTLTCAASVAAEGNGFGNEQLMTITAAALNDAPRIAFKNSVGTIENKMVAGRTYQAECQLRLNSTNWAQTPISEIYFEMSIGANSGETWRSTALNQYENVVPLESSGSNQIVLHLKTNPTTLPSTITSLDSCQLDIRIRHQAAQSAGTLIMGVSRIAVRDITPDLFSNTLF